MITPRGNLNFDLAAPGEERRPVRSRQARWTRFSHCWHLSPLPVSLTNMFQPSAIRLARGDLVYIAAGRGLPNYPLD